MNSLNFRLIIPLFFLSATALSQEKDSTETMHIIALRFGVNQIKDENLNTKVSTGTLTEFSYGFEKRTASWQKFHLTLGYSRLKTQVEDLSKSVNLKLNTGYSMSFKIVQGNNFKYYLGPEANIAYDGCFFPNWDDSHLYWADYFSVGVRNIFSVKLKNKNEWVTDVSIPLFSVFSRPELYRLYKIDDTDFGGIVHNLNSDLTAAHLTNVFFFHLQTEYRFPVFKNKTQAFTYSFEWLRVKNNDGNPFSQLSHQIGIKFFI
jgi:hypothetical protein